MDPDATPPAGSDHAPGRVRITSPLTSAAPLVRRSVRQEIDDETAVGTLYVRTLVRSQLRSALAVSVVVILGLGGLPLAFTLVPGLATLEVAGVALPWIVLGVLVYPAILLVGWLYVRQAERAESDFADLVGAGDADEPPGTGSEADGRGRR